MRNMTRSTVLLVGSASLGSAAWAQSSSPCCNQSCPERRFVTASGTGVVTAAADMAIIRVNSKVFGPDGKTASANAEATYAEIAQALSGLGIPKTSIESTSPILQRTQSYELQLYPMGTEERARRQYTVSQIWIIRVKPNQASATLKAAIEAGAGEDAAIQWIVRDPGALQAKASASAIANARSIAEKLAQTSGVKLGRLNNVDELQSPVTYSSYGASAPAFGMGDAVITMGTGMAGNQPFAVNSSQLQFKATVRVTFMIQDDGASAK